MTHENVSQETALALADQAPQLPAVATEIGITSAALDRLQVNIRALQDRVVGVLESGIDYGVTPGTHGPGLWEPGADKVFAAFGCYAEPICLKDEHDDESGLIRYMFRAEVLSLATSQRVAVGIGVSSTLEGKYGYRWVEDPEVFGYPKSEVRKRHDKQSGSLKYRIPNPDTGDLDHTLSQMAWKRAKVDAAQALPGVSSVLRRLFSGAPIPHKAPVSKAADTVASPPPAAIPATDHHADTYTEVAPGWNAFWGEIRSLGFTPEQARKALGVDSVLEGWIKKGFTLQSARQIILEKLAPEVER